MLYWSRPVDEKLHAVPARDDGRLAPVALCGKAMPVDAAYMNGPLRLDMRHVACQACFEGLVNMYPMVVTRYIDRHADEGLPEYPVTREESDDDAIADFTFSPFAPATEVTSDDDRDD